MASSGGTIFRQKKQIWKKYLMKEKFERANNIKLYCAIFWETPDKSWETYGRRKSMYLISLGVCIGKHEVGQRVPVYIYLK